MDHSDKSLAVEVLLREYGTLRDEILSRVRARFELLGFIVAISAFLGSKDVGIPWRIVFVAVGAVLALAVWTWLANNIKACATRIREIEAKVNLLMGDSLLEWETTRPQHSWLDRRIR